MVGEDKTRIQISIPNDLLAWVDRLAKKSGVSRSDVIALATLHYLEDWSPAAFEDAESIVHGDQKAAERSMGFYREHDLL